MNPNQALWEKGDFTRIASSMRDSGDALVERINITPGSDVLDLGCGDGTTAVPAAKRGANVLGIDIAHNLVEAGNLRAKEQNLANLRFQHGDACALDEVGNDSFDLVVSVFGAMFAPRPSDVAREMVRVTRPWWPHRHGQLDPRRPDAGGPAPENQLLLLPTTPRGLCQPHDLGSRRERRGALCRRWDSGQVRHL